MSHVHTNVRICTYSTSWWISAFTECGGIDYRQFRKVQEVLSGAISCALLVYFLTQTTTSLPVFGGCCVTSRLECVRKK